MKFRDWGDVIMLGLTLFAGSMALLIIIGVIKSLVVGRC